LVSDNNLCKKHKKLVLWHNNIRRKGSGKKENVKLQGVNM